MIEKNIFLLLGSNLQGSGGLPLRRGSAQTEKEIGALICKMSMVYETAAWGKLDQPDFLNQAIWLESSLSPDELLLKILAIEKSMGRMRLEKWGARAIDIDVLYYGQQLINTSSLVVPHPHLWERKFVLIPLVEISPEFIHPQLRKSNRQLLKECKDGLTVKEFTG